MATPQELNRSGLDKLREAGLAGNNNVIFFSFNVLEVKHVGTFGRFPIQINHLFVFHYHCRVC